MRALAVGLLGMCFVCACHAQAARQPTSPTLSADRQAHVNAQHSSTQEAAAPRSTQAPVPSQLRDGCLASQLEAQQEAGYLDSLAAQPLGSLPQASIQRVIDSHAREVRGCYQSALISTRSLSGSVGVHFVIALDGSVPFAEVTSGTPELRELGCCITRYIRSWTFDVPADHGVVHVQYPYTLDSVATQSELWTSVATPADATPQVGALTVRELTSVIDARQPDLQRCYERTAVGVPPKLRVVIRLRIAAEGVVRQVSVGPEASAALRACIRARAQTWRFPRARLDSEFGFDMRFSHQGR